jgi:hypothetical protein
MKLFYNDYEYKGVVDGRTKKILFSMEVVMKKLFVMVAVVAVIAMVVGTSTLTANQVKVLTFQEQQKAIAGYRYALQSSNAGVRLSAINYVHRYHLSALTNELIRILKEDSMETVRFAAALALVDIGGKDGRDAVAEAMYDESSPRLAEFCKCLLSSRLEV